MTTYTVANITDITGNADWTFDGSNNQIGATGVGLSIGGPSGGPVADSVNISGNYFINNVSVTAGLAPLASPTFTGTVTTSALAVGAVATFSNTLSVTGTTTLSGGANVTGIVNATVGFQIGGNSIYASPALTGVPTVPTASAGTNTTQAASCAFVTNAVSSFGGNPNPNKLINPFVEIDQTNEGSSVTLASGTPAYIVDGWAVSYGGASGAVVSAQRVTSAPPGYPNSVKVTVSTGGTFAAGSFLHVFQPIEADNLIDTAFGTASAQSLAVTFWLMSSISGVYSGAIQNYANTRSYPFNVTLSAANTWQKFEIIIPGDTGGTWVTSGNAGGMYLEVTAVGGSTFQGTANSWAFANTFATSSNTNSLLSTSGATFQVGPAKLEVSTTATPLVRVSIEDEQSNCERYYRKSYATGVKPGTAVGAGSNGTIWGAGVTAAVSPNASNFTTFYGISMRAAPSISIWDGAGNAAALSFFTSSWQNSGSGSIINSTNKSHVVNFPMNSAAIAIGYDYVANARL